MRRVLLPGFAGLLGLTLLAGGSSFGDDQAPATKKQQKQTANKPVAPESLKATNAGETKDATKAHLPPGFAKVNLTPEQRQKADAVNAKYAGEIKQLKAQIKELTSKRDAELSALLSDVQKQSLAEVKETSKKAREEKRAAAGKLMTGRRGHMKIDVSGLKAAHDQAVQNLAAEQKLERGAEQPQTGETPKANVKKNAKIKAKAEAKEQSKDESKEKSTTPEQTPEKK